MKWRRFFFSSKTENNIGEGGIRPIWVFLLIVVAIYVNIDLFLGEYFRTDKVSMEQLWAEFHKIQPLPESYSYDLTITDKYLVQSIGSSYVARLSQEKILFYYKTQLLKNGWRYRGDIRRIYEGTARGENFCKGRILGSIEFVPGENANETEYDFSVAVSSSDSECK